MQSEQSEKLPIPRGAEHATEVIYQSSFDRRVQGNAQRAAHADGNGFAVVTARARRTVDFPGPCTTDVVEPTGGGVGIRIAMIKRGNRSVTGSPNPGSPVFRPTASVRYASLQ